MCTYFITHLRPILLNTYPYKSPNIFYKIPPIYFQYKFNITLRYTYKNISLIYS
jgi:hypothetical protein